MRHLREADFRELQRLIRETRDIATMERMSVSNMDGDDALKPGESADDFIRRKTKCWRNSWLLSPLDAALEILEEKARRD